MTKFQEGDRVYVPWKWIFAWSVVTMPTRAPWTVTAVACGVFVLDNMQGYREEEAYCFEKVKGFGE